MQNFNALGNIQLGKDYILFSLNPKIHSLQTIKKAALALADKACIILDGDPQREILVEIRAKNHSQHQYLHQHQHILIEDFNNLLHHVASD